MNDQTMCWGALAAWIGLWIGMALEAVGDTPTNTGPYGYSLVFSVAVFLLVTAILGYNAGKSDGEAE